MTDLINATESAAARAASAGLYEDAALLLTASNVLAGHPEK
jgi:hypothetical protein